METKKKRLAGTESCDAEPFRTTFFFFLPIDTERQTDREKLTDIKINYFYCSFIFCSFPSPHNMGDIVCGNDIWLARTLFFFFCLPILYGFTAEHRMNKKIVSWRRRCCATFRFHRLIYLMFKVWVILIVLLSRAASVVWILLRAETDNFPFLNYGLK